MLCAVVAVGVFGAAGASAAEVAIADSQRPHTVQESVQEVIAKPDLYDYVYRIGVNGFVRGEGAGTFRLPDFSYAPGHTEGRFLYRVKPYLYWHPTEWLDLHAEGQGYGYTGGSQYLGKVSLYQGFAEILCPMLEGNSLKAGRQEFLNQATDTSLTGDMNVVGDLSGLDVGDLHASGLQICTLGWGVDLTKVLNLSATGRYFLANHAPEGASRRIGLETDFTPTYAMSDNLSVIASYDRFFTGKFFRDASGSNDDIHYGYLTVQFDLSRAKPKQVAKR